MCKPLHVFSPYSLVLIWFVRDQFLWSEAQPNNSSTAA